MKKILIIEDDPDILFILTHILEENGYEVFCSLTDNEIEELCKIVPDLILLDLRLGGSTRTGAEICIFFKTHPITQYLPVILVSAEQNIAEIALTCGANAYVQKPFDIDHITERVKEFI